jgi:hypothetical protein
LGIPGLDASKMAEKRPQGSPGACAIANAAHGGLCSAKLVSDNKIETIQSVLRHFLREIEGPGLGKS